MTIKERLEALGEKLAAEYRDNPVARLIGELHAEIVALETRVATIEGHVGATVEVAEKALLHVHDPEIHATLSAKLATADAGSTPAPAAAEAPKESAPA